MARDGPAGRVPDRPARRPGAGGGSPLGGLRPGAAGGPADGALLATVPSGGPFEALRLARRLEPGLVAADLGAEALGGAIRAAFELPADRVAAYRRRAAAMLAPYAPEAVQKTVERDVLPVLLS